MLLYAIYLLSKIRGLCRWIRLPNGRRIRVHFIETDKVLSFIYPYFLFIDLVISYLLYRIVDSFRNVNVIIYDRCPLDTLVDVCYIRRRSGLRFERVLLKLYLSFTFTLTENIIVLDVSENVALSRKDDIVSLRELTFKRRLFRVLSRVLRLHLTDTSDKDIASTLRDILTNIKIP